MTKTITTTQEKKVCDACDTILTLPDVLRNDGSYQDTFITKGAVDLCFKCAARLFKSLDVPEETFKESLSELQSTIRRYPDRGAPAYIYLSGNIADDEDKDFGMYGDGVRPFQ